jgi:7-cyano-7-deazaguanine synthase in queuosine biosynthesis
MEYGISVLFSGGPDSALAALIALEQAETVHLLTFHNKRMKMVGRHRVVTEELKKIYGEHRVFSYEADTNELFNTFYFKALKGKLSKYRTFCVPWLCGACKLAMHSLAIKYNIEHGVNTTYCGANVETEPYFVDQAKPYINVMKEFYKKYNMIYDCPVYDINSTDKEAEKYGLTTMKGTKKEHFVFSTQHACMSGVYVHLHARLYYHLFRGKKRAQRLAEKFLIDTLEEFESSFPI